MTPAEMDAEVRAAVEALVYRLQNRTPGTDPLGPDAEPFAAEFIAAMKARGWRPTPARPSPDWRQQAGTAGSLDPGSWEAIKKGDWEALRRIQGTTSAVPVPRPAPEDNDSNEEETK